MTRYSDYDDNEPDETNELTVGAALVGMLVLPWLVPLIELFRRRRNPRHARLFSTWAKVTIEVVGIVVFMLAAIVLTGAQP